SKGEMSGGPMYYLEHGLKAKWLGILFALFGAIAAFGIGNMVQSNSISTSIESSFNVPTWVTGFVLTILIDLVFLGCIKSIVKVSDLFDAIMAVIYIIGNLIIMIINCDIVP